MQNGGGLPGGPNGVETGSRIPRDQNGMTMTPDRAAARSDPPSIKALVVSQGYGAVPGLALANTSRDAELIARTFRQLRFDGVTAQDQGTPADTLQAIADYLAALNRNTISVIYLAGHGVEIGGENLFLLEDGSSFLSLQALVQVLQQRAGVTILFLDACRNNPFAAQPPSGATVSRALGLEGARPQLQTVSLAQLQAPDFDAAQRLRAFSLQGSGIKIVFSTDPANVALDGARPTSRNSPFASALARRIREPLSLDDIISLTTGDVIRATRRIQSPWAQGSIDRPIFLSGRRRRIQGALPDPIQMAT